MAERGEPGGRAPEWGERPRDEIARHFGRMYAGWDRGVNMEGPDSGFRETSMTPMELEARFVAAEVGLNIYQLANSAAFAPILVYQAIQKYLGPVFEAARREGMEAAARIADEYASVNREIAGDSILLDPVLRGRGFTPQNVAESERQQINGTIHSAMFHAAQNIATAIRKAASQTEGKDAE